jgi:hypothetical protein
MGDTLRVTIWHDGTGAIAAVGREMGTAPTVVPLASDNFEALELEIDVDEESLRELHRTHSVDVKQGSLVKRSSSL